MPSAPASPFAAIPSVDRLLGRDDAAALAAAHGRALVIEALRDATNTLREVIGKYGAGALPADVEAHLVAEARRQVTRLMADSLKPVINLTGTVLHTNLGRAPLPPEAVAAMVRAAGASNVEYDLERGRRGERDQHVEGWLRRLTGAEAALAVNNNAAAVLLVLNTLARGRQVPVSRGELIEIGGAFRMPDIMARAGCRLLEVGTTNRTHPADFAATADHAPAMLLKVHPSNFSIQGFTRESSTGELADVAGSLGVPLCVDLGSGSLVDLTRWGLPAEPTPAQVLAQGANLVTFSGDKLLGGVQAGIIVGDAELVAACNRNTMKRALRADKITLALLEQLLGLYEDPDSLPQTLPLLRTLTQPIDALTERAEQVSATLAPRLPAATVEVVDSECQIGSGALPDRPLPSVAVRITPAPGTDVDALHAGFRNLPVPVVGRVTRGALWLDMRGAEPLEALLASLAALDSGS